MPIAIYRAKETSRPLAINFQTLVGDITLTEGENPITEVQAAELERLKSTPDFEWYAIAISIKSEAKASKTEVPKIVAPEISLMTAEEAIAAISKIKDQAILAALLEEEATGEARKTVTAAINRAIAALGK